MTMHSHQTYNFRFQLLRQKFVSAHNIADVCCNSHVQEKMVSSNRFISIEGKNVYLDFQNLGCHCKILGCHFDTPKRLKINTG